MKKLFMSVLVACLMLTYTTTAYACQEDTTTQTAPASDAPMLPFPLDPYNN